MIYLIEYKSLRQSSLSLSYCQMTVESKMARNGFLAGNRGTCIWDPTIIQLLADIPFALANPLCFFSVCFSTTCFVQFACCVFKRYKRFLRIKGHDVAGVLGKNNTNSNISVTLVYNFSSLISQSPVVSSKVLG